MTGEKDPRDVMQAEHDARLSEHPAFRAPAEMPGVEEIARLIDPEAWDIYLPHMDRAGAQEKGCRKARAVFALFAPILAEKEREIAVLKTERRLATAQGTGLQARALAAEAALEKAVVFDLGNHQTIESRGDGRWAIKDAGCVLNADGVWEYEPNPSNRTDDFIARTRFDRDDAFRRAAAIRAQGE